MTVEEELKACLLVISHLDDESFDVSDGFDSFGEHPPFKDMRLYLKDYDHDMMSFTNYINKIQQEPLWTFTAREFYSTTKSRIFYKRIIRNLKLELLCQN